MRATPISPRRAFALEAFEGDEEQVDAFITQIFDNVPVFDTGGRGATTTFVERQLGDVLITFEAETKGIAQEFGEENFETVIPSQSLLAEFPVAVVDRVAERRGTEELARAYLGFLYSEEGTAHPRRAWQPRSRRDRGRRIRGPVSRGPAGDGRGRVRRLGPGAGRAFRRRRPARPAVRRALNPTRASDWSRRATARRLSLRRDVSTVARKPVIPGLKLSLGVTLFYVGVIIALPIGGADFQGGEPRPGGLLADRLVAARGGELSSHGSGRTGGHRFNLVFGSRSPGCWCATTFPGRRIVDAIVDLPFALPTAVAGIALTALFAPNGWFGSILMDWGIRVAYTPLGIMIAMSFTSLPFIVRTVQPVLEDLDPALEEAAQSLGGSDASIFAKVILPLLAPALMAGVSLSFARSLGEFGAIIFIAGNQPMQTEITALLAYIRLEEFNYPAAAAIASVLLFTAFVMLAVTNAAQAWALRYTRRG
jgi:sulfate/thiosulfate transport system permease protein